MRLSVPSRVHAAVGVLVGLLVLFSLALPAVPASAGFTPTPTPLPPTATPVPPTATPKPSTSSQDQPAPTATPSPSPTPIVPLMPATGPWTGGAVLPLTVGLVVGLLVLVGISPSRRDRVA